ncbi:hypothetical protein NHH03_05575 [Stieleria sp. TO1_6]|uniref:hypothetical protein n=1 Tax=Stieleria tagensis TaxID=2956795 RepID=UPI00209BBA04|nr:hypothetical protein [Stieleria tagensis]MCO8121199.1 hypothetical protein [Stieleria tagensis]
MHNRLTTPQRIGSSDTSCRCTVAANAPPILATGIRATFGLLMAIVIAGYPADAPAQLPVIQLRALSQSFFAAGEQADVSIAEAVNDGGAAELLFSQPGITAQLKAPPENFAANDAAATKSPEKACFQLSVAADTPPGRYEARVLGEFGISNPRSIVVGAAVRQTDTVGHSVQAATPIEQQVIYAGQTTARMIDCYALPVSAGQSIEVRLIGQAVDSRIIGVISVLDAHGKTMASAMGSNRTDASLVATADRNETLTIAVHDALFRGGASYPYGLLVSAPNTDSTRVSLSADRLPSAISANLEAAPFRAEDDSLVALEVPGMVEARFDSADDHDGYLCELKKDQPIEISVYSARLGQPSDPRIVVDQAVEDDSGQRRWRQVATADDSQDISDGLLHLGTKDPVLHYQPPADGLYRISVSDLDTGRSLGAVQRYVLAVQPPRQDWQLLAYPVYPEKTLQSAMPAGVCLRRGGTETIRVFVVRDGMQQPIQITVGGLPEGVSCQSGWIASGQNHTDLTLSAAEDVAEHDFDLDVMGQVEGQDASAARHAKYASLIWEKDDQNPTPRTKLVDRLTIATSAGEAAPLSLSPVKTDAVSVAVDSQVTIPMKIVRREGGQGRSIVLRPQHLPPGCTAADLTIAADQTEAEWSITVTANAKPGTYSFWGQGEAKVKLSSMKQELTAYVPTPLITLGVN